LLPLLMERQLPFITRMKLDRILHSARVAVAALAVAVAALPPVPAAAAGHRADPTVEQPRKKKRTTRRRSTRRPAR
jgi:hypothetical protein